MHLLLRGLKNKTMELINNLLNKTDHIVYNIFLLIIVPLSFLVLSKRRIIIKWSSKLKIIKLNIGDNLHTNHTD